MGGVEHVAGEEPEEESLPEPPAILAVDAAAYMLIAEDLGRLESSTRGEMVARLLAVSRAVIYSSAKPRAGTNFFAPPFGEKLLLVTSPSLQRRSASFPAFARAEPVPRGNARFRRS